MKVNYEIKIGAKPFPKETGAYCERERNRTEKGALRDESLKSEIAVDSVQISALGVPSSDYADLPIKSGSAAYTLALRSSNVRAQG
jgi:hypothetical protein